MIPRDLSRVILNELSPGFISVVYGPRRVGKTTLIRDLLPRLPKPHLWLDGDTQETRDALSSTSEVKLSSLVSPASTIVVDEAQRIANIGLSLKILVDKYPQKKFIVSGSSSLELARGIQEPLTGRTRKYKLYPLSTHELTAHLPGFQKASLLNSQLRFGGYPYLIQLTPESQKARYLKSLIEDYIFRDISLLKDLSHPENLRKLATLLAFQIGSEVSLNELANNLTIDVKTVSKYINLLKESFIIIEVGAYSTNFRKEIAKSKKYYFWDLGIRNGLIDGFLELDSRTDIGALWENFLAIERIKLHEYKRIFKSYYFWRSRSQAEVDWIEKTGESITAYEFKFHSRKPRTPKLFLDTYHTRVNLVTNENYLEFIH